MRLPNWIENTSGVINAVTFGPPGHSLCARAYVHYPWLAKMIDVLFFFDKQHCRKSYLRRRKDV